VSRVAEALAARLAGQMAGVADNSDPEDEGNLVTAAGTMITGAMAFSLSEGSAVVGAALPSSTRRKGRYARRFRISVADDHDKVCDAFAEYDGGDHTIVAAPVIDLDDGPGRTPLLFDRVANGLQRAVHIEEA
jgi:hypothetical protein